MYQPNRKVGILTMYYTNISHGGLLQAYSLCKKIQDMGYDAEQITYDYNERFRHYTFLKKIKIFLKSIPQSITCKVVRDNSKNKYYGYMEEVPHSKLYSTDDMKTINDDYDIFVVGSDQVWNELYCDDYFYFPNVKKKKISYAASVGRDNLTEDELINIGSKTSDFSAISVREKNLQLMLQEHSKNNVDLVCDPVFLNDSAFWSSHSVTTYFHEDYVLVYLLGEDRKVKAKTIQLAQKIGKIVVTVPNVNLNANVIDLFSSNQLAWNVGPREFLGLIKNARFILTDSFHCTAFSIIFNREFCCFDRGGSEKRMNSRLVSILNLLDIGDRFININSTDTVKLQEIDYKSVNKKLIKYKEESEKWLMNALNE